MKSSKFDGKCIQEPNYSQLQGKCLEQHTVKHLSIRVNDKLLVQKKNFNRPSLPKHIDENTVFGIRNKNEFGISDVIFPNKSSEDRFVESKNSSELHNEISHHLNGAGKQLNRNYTSPFDPNHRYGKHVKWIPAGVWFKNDVEQISPNKDKNDKTDYVSKLLESNVKYKHCNRYPYVDDRQGKFLGRSYLRVGDILTGNEPNEKELEIIDYLSAINKIKLIVKKKKYNVKELRDKYKCLDQEQTGWLPLNLVYEVCYQQQIRPEKKMFDLALNSIHAINDHDVHYNLFVDLIDPNVQFLVNFSKDNKSEINRFKPTYKSDYKNTFIQSIQSNKNTDNNGASSYRPVKPLVLAHQDCFGSETDVKTLLSPTIFSNYGLTYRDFYIKRSKDVMEKLLKTIGVNLPNDTFNTIWNNAYQCDGFNDQVSIETFMQTLREFTNNNMNDHHMTRTIDDNIKF